MLDYKSTTPLYMQIANWLETEILKGNFSVDEKVYSQYKLAEVFQINPATAARGLTLLTEEGILYDRRGLGKFVTKEAVQIIREKRKRTILQQSVATLIKEAIYLQIDEDSLVDIIRNAYRKQKEGQDDSLSKRK
ncbi:MAG TPA: GntR family transcriptional regulator [Pseudogracilibacillus sp.]|nr:GntR family transcriptional regulator [Pseudogracilibacillus sp.]